jgi:hypothetical protein
MWQKSLTFVYKGLYLLFRLGKPTQRAISKSPIPAFHICLPAYRADDRYLILFLQVMNNIERTFLFHFRQVMDFIEAYNSKPHIQD